MKNNRNRKVRVVKVLLGRRKTDSPFVPPRVLVPETQSIEQDSEEETQLPKDQPIWDVQTEGGETDRPTDSDSEGETQLPKDQPSYIPETGETSTDLIEKDFVPVESIYLEERLSQDDEDIPVAVILEREKEKLKTKLERLRQVQTMRTTSL